MDLATRKYNLIRELTTIDESLLEKLEQFLKANRKDWFTDLSEEEQHEIEVGLNQAKNNELVNHDKVMNKFSKWH
ncbi:MAG: hypothetical protein ACOVQR_04120 [Flavobacterium sp.]|jgi:predicted transcriptional regulator|uniref:hypothetical protein n=1 Tax=Flavobacterium sp. TaxID=239 RepID=UPI003BA5F668